MGTVPVNEIFWASGTKGNLVRADGNGGSMRRGFYFNRIDGTTAGPFDSRTQAELIRDIEGPRRLRPHESALFPAELNALRALRRKGIVTKVGIYLERRGDHA